MKIKIRKMMSALLMMGVFFLIVSCASSNSGAGKKSEEKIGAELSKDAAIKEGKIDSVTVVHSPTRETVTLVGFESGDGCILRGVYPGLQKGKSVKLTLKILERTFRETSVFEVLKIEKLAEGEDASTDQIPPPSGF